ncbi:reverse transcriptase domain-containing protein [Tanacetum coccineum]
MVLIKERGTKGRRTPGRRVGAPVVVDGLPNNIGGSHRRLSSPKDIRRWRKFFESHVRALLHKPKTRYKGEVKGVKDTISRILRGNGDENPRSCDIHDSLDDKIPKCQWGSNHGNQKRNSPRMPKDRGSTGTSSKEGVTYPRIRASKPKEVSKKEETHIQKEKRLKKTPPLIRGVALKEGSKWKNKPTETPKENKLSEKVTVNDHHPDQPITIRGSLSRECRADFIKVLRRHADAFAWTPADMTGIPRFIAEHRIPPNTNVQEGRRKNDIPHQRRSLLLHKMSFGLKNTGATYHRLVDTIFEGHIGRNLEAYVDNMVIKIKTEQDLIKDIEETLLTLKKVNMKLNPKKCLFRMEDGKFLRYIVTSEVIRANPEKIKAVMSMPSPRNLKQIKEWKAGADLLCEPVAARCRSKLCSDGKTSPRTSTCRQEAKEIFPGPCSQGHHEQTHKSNIEQPRRVRKTRQIGDDSTNGRAPSPAATLNSKEVPESSKSKEEHANSDPMVEAGA